MIELTVSHLEGAAGLAIGWLLESGIQNMTDEDPSLKGGVSAWYDSVRQCYPFVYSEITGYAITALTYLHVQTGDDQFLGRAQSAADWLLEEAFDPTTGYFRCQYSLDAHAFIPRAYAFDEAMILNGLTSLCRTTDEVRYREAAELGAQRLVTKWQRDDGAFTPFQSLSPTDTVDKIQKWSRQPGSFQAKNAIGLLNLYQITGAPALKDSVVKVCDRALGFQHQTGFFVTSTYDDSTHLHPHCYSAEGLWVAGKLLGREEYLESATRAVRWALDQQLPNGGIPRIYLNGEFNGQERSDIIAQVIRLGILLIHEGRLGRAYLDNVERALERLLSFQCLEGSAQEKGGFVFGFQDDGLPANHVNSWCTMFALQAILMYLQHRQGSLDFDPLLLV